MSPALAGRFFTTEPPGEEWTCICMTKSLHCPPETTATLLIGYTPIQNIPSAKKKKKSVFDRKKKPYLTDQK